MLNISKIKVSLLFKDEFLGSILSSTEVIEDKSSETACTDGDKIYYNEEFINSLSENDALFVFAHEVAHIAFKHAYRAKQLNIKDDLILWNIASDYVVNYELEKSGFKIAKFALKPLEKYYNKDTETIYNDLKRLQRKNKLQEVTIPQDLKPSENVNEFLQDCVDAKASKTLKSINGFGSGNEEFKRIVKTYCDSSVPWNVILRNFYSGFKQELYSFYRPSRRSTEFYLPSKCLNDYVFNEVNAYVDCSLSIDNKLFSTFIYELKYIFIDLELEKMHINTFSNKIITRKTFTNSEDIIQLETYSPMGTSIKDVINDINKTESLFNIIFTDGKFNTKYIDKCIKDDNEIIWVIYNNDEFLPSRGTLIKV